MVHRIKIEKNYADRIIDQVKTFEVRKNDRDYQVGDIIQFRVINPDTYSCYSDYDLNYHALYDEEYEIIYIHTGLGMKDGYVILGIQRKE